MPWRGPPKRAVRHLAFLTEQSRPRNREATLYCICDDYLGCFCISYCWGIACQKAAHHHQQNHHHTLICIIHSNRLLQYHYCVRSNVIDLVLNRDALRSKFIFYFSTLKQRINHQIKLPIFHLSLPFRWIESRTKRTSIICRYYVISLRG